MKARPGRILLRKICRSGAASARLIRRRLMPGPLTWPWTVTSSTICIRTSTRPSDYGKTWTKLGQGIPDNQFVRVVREDPKKRGLLYAGTEQGVYVSFNDGANWRPLKLNLPTTPVHDLVIKDNDLVVATHGRAFWILDDLTPLRQFSDDVAQKEAFLYAPGYRISHPGRSRRRSASVEASRAESASRRCDLLLPERCAQGGSGGEDRDSRCFRQGDPQVFQRGIQLAGRAARSGRQETGKSSSSRKRD